MSDFDDMNDDIAAQWLREAGVDTSEFELDDTVSVDSLSEEELHVAMGGNLDAQDPTVTLSDIESDDYMPEVDRRKIRKTDIGDVYGRSGKPKARYFEEGKTDSDTLEDTRLNYRYGKRNKGGQISSSLDIEKQTDPYGFGGVSTIDVLAKRFNDTGNAAAALLVLGVDGSGYAGATTSGGEQTDATAQAREMVEKVTGKPYGEFASALRRTIPVGSAPSPVTRYGADGQPLGTSQPLLSATEYRKARSMLSDSLEGFLHTGGTSMLAGKKAAIQDASVVPFNVEGLTTQEVLDKQFDEQIVDITARLDNLAGKYMTPAGLKGEDAGKIQKRISNALAEHFASGVVHKRVAFDETGEAKRDPVTGEVVTYSNIFPTPAELMGGDLTGMKITMGDYVQGSFTGMGTTVFTNMEYAQLVEEEMSKTGKSRAEVESLPSMRAKRPNMIRTLKTNMVEFNELKEEAWALRGQLRELAVNDRNLADGFTKARVGFDLPDEEQYQRMQAYNDIALLDLQGKRAGDAMDTELSEADLALESLVEGTWNKEEVALDFVGPTLPETTAETLVPYGNPTGKVYGAPEGSDWEAYLRSPKGAEQGTAEWLQERAGKLSASLLTDFEKKGGSAYLAAQIARSNLGMRTFEGNAYSERGNRMEDLTRMAFMREVGRKQGLVYEEAFFEADEEREGFGASPDGRLYNKATGESEGLLEIKNLTEKNMVGATKKYYDQMQLQMAVTGETQVHFYARSADTGDAVYEMVKADPKRQEYLIQKGEEALMMAASLDVQGVKAVEKRIEEEKKMAKVRTQNELDALSIERRRKNTEGARVRPIKVEEDEPMGPFKPYEDDDVGEVSQDIMFEAARKAAKTRRTQQIAAAAKDMSKVSGGDEEVLIPGRTVDSSDQSMRSGPMDAKRAFEANQNRPTAFSGLDGEKVNHGYDDNVKSLAEAAKEAARDIKEFSKGAKEAGKILSEVGGIAAEGITSGVEEDKFARRLGLDVDQVRGIRKNLEQGDLVTREVDSILTGANRIRTMDTGQLAQFTADYSAQLAKDTASPALQGLLQGPLGDPNIFLGKDTQQILGTINKASEGLGRDDRSRLFSVFGIEDLAGYDETTGGDLGTALSGVRVNREGNEVMVRAAQLAREAKEFVGSGDEVSGAVGVAGKAAAWLAGSATAGFVGAKLMGSGAGSSLAAAAKSPMGAASRLATAAIPSAASVAAMAGVGAAGAAGYGVGSYLWNEMSDERQIQVSEMVGSGVDNVLAFFGNDDAQARLDSMSAMEGLDQVGTTQAVPASNLGSVPAPERSSPSKPIQNNVDVRVEITPEASRVFTNVNGDLSIDEEAGIGTGDR